MAKLQTLANKTGEVTFRKKLVRQHIGAEITSTGEPDFSENVREIKSRIELTRQMFTSLRHRGLRLSPFLEIAAGEGFRSDLLVTEFGARGFATDISQHTLAADRVISKELHLGKRSIKICCDAYNLPFLSNSFPLIFVALSLHHFPDPTPVIAEAVRVLTPTGYFYFDEEPIKQNLNFNLWRRDYHLRWFEKLLKYSIVLLFLSRIGRAEVDHGILEETFSLSTWAEALAPFAQAEIIQTVYPPSLGIKETKIKTNRADWINPKFLVRLGLFLFGGGIGGICQLQKKGIAQKFKTPADLLACPDCRMNDNLAPLKHKFNTLICTRCRKSYYKKKGVWILLEHKLEKQLYG